MCYSISLMADRAALEPRFEARSEGLGGWRPVRLANAFSAPDMPVVADSDRGGRAISPMRWGLVPRWTRDAEQARDMARKAANARAETLFEKPAFRESARGKRCLVPVTGFFETRHLRGAKFPYLIRLRDEPVFSLAGIWSEWADPSGEGALRTFSIVTTDANPMMAVIHNTKLRMPVILDREGEGRWLDRDAGEAELKRLLGPFDEGRMAAHPVSRIALRRGAILDSDEVLRPYDYPELASSQATLF